MKQRFPSIFNLVLLFFPYFLTPTVMRSPPQVQWHTKSQVTPLILYKAKSLLTTPVNKCYITCLCFCTHNLPLSHLESCCSVLIGWWCPRVLKIAKSRPIKSAAVPEYSSPSALWQNETTYTYFNSIKERKTKQIKQKTSYMFWPY